MFVCIDNVVRNVTGIYIFHALEINALTEDNFLQIESSLPDVTLYRYRDDAPVSCVCRSVCDSA